MIIIKSVLNSNLIVLYQLASMTWSNPSHYIVLIPAQTSLYTLVLYTAFPPTPQNLDLFRNIALSLNQWETSFQTVWPIAGL